MKLTKAQQEVLDALRAGDVAQLVVGGYWYLRKLQKVCTRQIQALDAKGLIVMRGGREDSPTTAHAKREA